MRLAAPPLARPAVLALALAAAVPPAIPAAARAGTVALDRSCYAEQAPIAVAGSGFTPGGALTVSAGGAPVTVTADAAGTFALSLPAPLSPSLGARPGDVADATLSVTDPADPAQDATAALRIANFAFETSGGMRSPRARRTWWFSGFTPGRPIYGHFRHRGRLRGTYRFGRAQGPCGLLERRAPGIPVARRWIRSGRWTVQVDQVRRYSRRTSPALVASTTVFVTLR